MGTNLGGTRHHLASGEIRDITPSADETPRNKTLPEVAALICVKVATRCRCHTEGMDIGLTQLRILLSVIIVIAAGIVAGTAFAGQEPGKVTNIGAVADVAVPSIGGLNQVTGYVTATGQDHHGCCREHRPDCAYGTGSGCCAAYIFATGESRIANRAPGAVRFLAGTGLLATGIDPEALQQPPQIFA